MKVVRNLQADVYGMRRAFLAGRGTAHHSAARAFRYARHQSILAGERNARLGFTKAHHRTRVSTRNETPPVNGDLPAWDGRRGRNSFDVRNAVLFWRRAEPEFHTQPM